MKYYNIFLSLVAAAAMTACSDEADAPVMPDTSDGITINVECTDMLPEALLSRAGEDLGPAKTAEEKRINRLHLFFFDKKSGEFLTMNTAQQDGANLFRPYHVVDVADGQQAAVTIPKDAFVDQAKLTDIIIYAVANVTCQDNSCDHKSSSFRTTFTSDGHICHGAKDNADAEVTVDNLEVLRNWYYRPAIREDITKLPEGGMPMVGEFDSEGKAILSGNQRIEIKMKALMARVDVNVKLDANQTSHDHQLPSLRITSYGVNNMPTCVPFTELSADAETVLMDPENDMRKEALVEIPEAQRRTLLDGQEAATFSYYTYENVRKPLSETYDYPAGVDVNDEEVTQRWKPKRAKVDEASSFVMYGDYVTHQGLQYKAGFRVYLGSDVVSKFDVYRNRCYINNISIRGLDYVRNDDDTRYTFDGRVNVKTDNPVYISIVNERKLDAHATALPMDIYFLKVENGTVSCNSQVDIELLPDVQPDGQTRIPDWIRMEMVGAAQMAREAGGVNSDGFTDDLPAWSAGKGARRYFTAGLLTDGSLVNNTKLTIHNNFDGSYPSEGSRSRVYFYVDENVPESNNPVGYGDRTARVRIHYTNDEGEDRDRVLEIDQKALLRVYDSSKNVNAWMEYYEEYLDHKDPLDNHDMPGELYEGLPWGLNGTSTSGYSGTSYEVYTDGQAMTNWVLNRGGAVSINTVRLFNVTEDRKPVTCFHYASGKNKRNEDGTRAGNNWYMPGIRELEVGLEQYYSTFKEFDENLYWSASAGKRVRVALGVTNAQGEFTERARATNINVNGAHIESQSHYTGMTWNNLSHHDLGSQPRTSIHRIRAFYKP